MRQSFKYRLYPNKAQQQIIEDTLEHCRLLYNRLLAERKEAYEKSGKTLSYVVQANSFPARKQAIPALTSVHSQVLQNVAKRLDKAFDAFFRRVKAGEKPGYPRFKSFGRYHSFTYPQGGYTIEQGRVHLSKIGTVKIKLHRPIEGTIKTCTVVVKNGRYYRVKRWRRAKVLGPTLNGRHRLTIGGGLMPSKTPGHEVRVLSSTWRSLMQPRLCHQVF